MRARRPLALVLAPFVLAPLVLAGCESAKHGTGTPGSTSTSPTVIIDYAAPTLDASKRLVEAYLTALVDKDVTTAENSVCTNVPADQHAGKAVTVTGFRYVSTQADDFAYRHVTYTVEVSPGGAVKRVFEVRQDGGGVHFCDDNKWGS